jgi:hypothetical protein
MFYMILVYIKPRLVWLFIPKATAGQRSIEATRTKRALELCVSVVEYMPMWVTKKKQ